MKPLTRSIPTTDFRIALLACLALLLPGCGGGGGGGAPATAHQVTISWAPNHERAVEVDPGGGYIVNIPGQPQIKCPVGALPPPSPCTSAHSVQVTLMTGRYDVRVQAYSLLNGPGSTTGSMSNATTLTVLVP